MSAPELVQVQIRTFGPNETDEARAAAEALSSGPDAAVVLAPRPPGELGFAFIPILVGVVTLIEVGTWVWEKTHPVPCKVIDARKNPVDIYEDPDGPDRTIVVISADGKVELDHKDEAGLSDLLDALKKAGELLA